MSRASSDTRTPRAPLLPHLDVRTLAAIFAGGCTGTLARASLAHALPHDPGAWPWATFAVNLAGAFVLGAAVARLQHGGLRRLLIGTGFCGALTTFSTFELELLRMLDGGRIGLALVYAGASIAGGLGAVVLGTRVGGDRESEARRGPVRP